MEDHKDHRASKDLLDHRAHSEVHRVLSVLKGTQAPSERRDSKAHLVSKARQASGHRAHRESKEPPDLKECKEL